ncbi:hypothetical protein [Methylobacterium trifolii]|uniref:hypothetical protein n=1 Tax=Methylobacterium trifolii TaxID=1003092 RepID=UPI001EDECD57|nr:hypothetical protein [Methylobacterium trifolii]
MAETTEELIGERFTQGVLDEIIDAFVTAGKEPSEQFLDGLTVLYSKSPNELRRYFAIRAKSQGSNLLSDHLRDTD